MSYHIIELPTERTPESVAREIMERMEGAPEKVNYYQAHGPEGPTWSVTEGSRHDPDVLYVRNGNKGLLGGYRETCTLFNIMNGSLPEDELEMVLLEMMEGIPAQK